MEVHQSWWAMTGLGNGVREWTIEEKFEKIAENGFTGILGRLPEPQFQEQWKSLLDRYHLTFAIHSFPDSRHSLSSLLKQARQFGVQYVNSQVMDNLITGENAVRLLSELTEEAAVHKLPLFIETHRGRITQDLLRTAEYVKSLPSLRLTIDLSHYVLAGEIVEPEETNRLDPWFDTLLRRTSCIHGRVSNGQQIQIDVGISGGHPMVQPFVSWWEKGMYYWLQDAEQGDVLPFVCELGPPPYGITEGLPSVELSDRWNQSLVFKKLAEKAWTEASGRGYFPNKSFHEKMAAE
ncbi:TIM barrel protein [Paenibacillus terrigena]|uniref:sugar phosphate isomerase/epimerase family protein n=1 Tax=Paenibacillus terrigena TaxID=369333 RepID=UPI0028D88794|nr:TIM barrel protein [Paenibacillus terrigena]